MGYNYRIFQHKRKAFTIVELLVVIVVIGILAAITIVSYSNLSKKAIVASLQSDLISDAKELKMYNVEYGYYPNSTDADKRPLTPDIDNRYCLKYSIGTELTYTGSGQSFKLKATKNGITYYITEDIPPTPIGVPIVDFNTGVAVNGTTANIGATVTSDGGEPLLDAGTCWGTSANPTTNCQSALSGLGLLSLLGFTTAVTDSPISVVVSPDGKNVYTTNHLNAAITMYSRNTSNYLISTLAPLTISTGAYANGLAITSDGKYVYSTNDAVSTLSMLSRNSSTGLLNKLSTPTIATGSTPSYVAISPDDKSVYVTNYGSNTVSMYNRNSSTGILTVMSTPTITTGSNPNEIVVSSDGKSVYVTNYGSNTISMFSRDTSTGILSAMSTPTITAGGSPFGIAISNDGKSVYAANSVSSGTISMYVRNTDTGILTPNTTATISAGSYPKGIVVSPDGKSVYIANYASHNVGMYSCNQSTGLLTPMSTATISSARNPTNLAISSDGNSVYAAATFDDVVTMFSRNNAKVTVGNPFTKTRTGFTSGSTIHYRSYGTNSIGTGYSSDSTLTLP